MAAGGDTFIDEMLTICGFENTLKSKTRYPSLSLTDLQNLSPDFLFLSSEPYPFQTKHIDELQVKLPNTGIKLVNGEFFSWYGSRLPKSRSLLQKNDSAPLIFTNFYKVSLLKLIESVFKNRQDFVILTGYVYLT